MAKSQKMFISMSSISPIPQDDLSNWEFVNQSDCNYDVTSDDDAVFDVQSFDLDESMQSLSDYSSSDHDDVVDDVVDDDVDDVVDDVDDVEEKKDSPIIEDLEEIAVNFTKFDDFNVDLTNLAAVSPNYDLEQVELKEDSPTIEDLEKIAVNFTKLDDFDVNLINFAANYRNYDVERYDDEHDDDEDDDGDDMDDDLVPWEVKGLYMRERIKKSEKKSLTKMIKSKKPLKSVRGRFGQYHAVKAY